MSHLPSFKKLVPALVLLALALLVPVSASAAEPFRQMVTEVVVRFAGGAAKADPGEYVRSRITAEKNRYVSQAELAKDQRDLLDTGTFSDVRILVEKDGEGIRVIYDVVIAPRFRSPLAVSGNDVFSVRKIRNEFALSEGDRIDQPRLDILCDKLRAKYRDSYYPDAKVVATLSEPDADGFSSVSVRVDEGKKVRVARFEFSGNKALSDGELNKVLERPSRWNPFYVFYSAWRKQALDFQRVNDLVCRAYRDLGYLDVAIAPPSLSRADEGAAPVIRVAITEGPRYVVDAVAVSGAKIFPEEKLLEVAGRLVAPGTIASASLLSATSKQLEDYYGQRGYARTSVRMTLTPVPRKGDDPAGQARVQVAFAIREGVLARIRSIQIRGNTRTKDKVIRRELAVAPGQLYNEVAADRSRMRLENLGFFSSVRHDIDLLPGEEKDLGLTYFGDVGFKAVPSQDDEALVDLFYDVAEKDTTGQLMVGIGMSSVDNVLGYVEVSQNNFDIAHWPFTGGGQKARLSLSLGEDSRSGEITWSDPWFLDRRQNLSVELYRREIGFSEYDETRTGGSVSLTRPLKYGRLSLRLGGELVASDEFVPGDYTLRDDPAQSFRYDEIDDDYLRVPARVTWSYDSRNHPFVPSSGARNSVFAEVQNGALGSDYDNYKIGVDLRQYIPLWDRHVLSLRLRAETMDAYGDSDEIPLNDRLYLGGSRTIRGFRYREVGPKALPVDEVADVDGVSYHRRARPVGGRTLAMFSAEYSYKVVDMIRLAGWFDIGNVWADAFDADFGDYAASFGIGIRFDIPSLPIRLDYAFPQHEDDDYSRKEHFIFWIGFD